MPRLTSNVTAWILIIAVALALRLAAGFWWQSRLAPEQKFYFGDSDAYWVLGHAIARGDPYEYLSPERRVFRTPGYPLLLAGLFLVLGDDPPVMAARALSALFGAAAVGVVGWWATKLFDARAGRIAGWIAAVYPGAVAMGAFVLAESPFCLFMIAQLALWGIAWRAPSARSAIGWAVGGGIAGGIATLIRPSWLMFLPFALAIGLAFDKRRSRQATIGLAMAGALIGCMLPWWIRNARVTGHFVATTLQSGASLYDGLNPSADGSSDMRFGERIVAEERASKESDNAERFEYRLDRRMAHEALDWALANPASAARLAWIKFLRIWNVWPNEPSLRSVSVRLLVAATYVPLLCLAIVGAWRYAPRGWPFVLAWLPALYFTLLHMVFVGSLRYREPAMLALIVLAAGVLAGFSRDRPPPAIATGAGALPGP
jgi:4-amino-4-deoxy-L-arabinose transferase-like glycosyltransferase